MMSKGSRIRSVLTSEENSGILYEDMDDALIGIYRTSYGISLGIYSYVKYTELLINVKGMFEEDAVEYADSHVYKGIISEDSYHPLIIDDTGV
jgi:hypothetical protein